jgi:hypothetical protein
VPEVIAWYESAGYDFIVLTDHNRVTPPPAVEGAGDLGNPAAARRPGRRVPLLVLTGAELTFNPPACEPPPPEPNGGCRIHVNAVGATGRPEGRFRWIDRSTKDRKAAYRAALRATRLLDSLPQINHSNWHWGVTDELLAELTNEQQPLLLEVANAQFRAWDAGIPGKYASVEQRWDTLLATGAKVWAVASDDAHHYPTGKYPPGGGWIRVDADRSAESLMTALRDGRFYASTGIELREWSVSSDDQLIVEVSGETSPPLLEVFVDGQRVASQRGRRISWPVPAEGRVRVSVRADDGRSAWTQPRGRVPR